MGTENGGITVRCVARNEHREEEDFCFRPAHIELPHPKVGYLSGGDGRNPEGVDSLIPHGNNMSAGGYSRGTHESRYLLLLV